MYFERQEINDTYVLRTYTLYTRYRYEIIISVTDDRSRQYVTIYIYVRRAARNIISSWK